MLKFPNTKTEDGLIERTSSMLDEIELKSMVNDKEGDRERKKKEDFEWSEASQKHIRICIVF